MNPDVNDATCDARSLKVHTANTSHPVSAFRCFASLNVLLKIPCNFERGGLGIELGFRKVKRCLIEGESLTILQQLTRDLKELGATSLYPIFKGLFFAGSPMFHTRGSSDKHPDCKEPVIVGRHESR